MVKPLSTMQDTGVWPLGGEDPLEKRMATHSSILAWRIPWTEEPDGVQRVRHNWVTNTTHFHFSTYLPAQSYIIPPHPMLLIFSWDFILPLCQSPPPLFHFPPPIPTLLSTLMFEYLHLQTCRPILSPVSPRFFSSILDWPLGNNLITKGSNPF